MATPSVLTVPSMYGDGILYSGPTAYGSELVTNGNFATDSDWTKTSGAIISGGVAVITVTGGGYQSIAQSISLSNTKKYKLTALVNGTAGKAMTFVDNSANNGGLTTSNGVVTFDGQDQDVSITWIANSNSFEIEMIRNGSGDFSFTVKNISVKEITQGSDFDFTRATTGTRINEEGYIEDVPYNLFSYSEDFTNAYWSKFGTVETSGVLAPNNNSFAIKLIRTSGTYNIIRPSASIIGTDFNQSIFVKNINADNFYIRSGSGFIFYNFANKTTSSANLIASDIGNGWIKLTTSDVHATFKQYGIGENETDPTELNNAVYIWGAQLVKGDKTKNYLPTTSRVNLPRLNYPTYGGCPSLLFEPQRTNLVTYSTDYSNTAWSKNNLTVTLNSAISPEGIMNASLLVENSGTAQRFIGDSLSLSSGTSYSVSIYAKKKERSVLQISPSVSHIAASYANYDLDLGVVSATGGSVTAKIQSLNNDWYRCILTFTATSTATATLAFFIQNNPTAIRGAAYQGDGSNSMYLYGAQVEAGSYATSLIHTSGSTVTRNEDIAADAGLGTTDTFNDSEGVFYAEIRSDDPEPTAVYTSINDGSGGQNQVRIGYLIGSLYSQIRVAGSAFYALNITEADVTQNNKVAVRYKAGDHAVFLNGFKLSTNTSSDIFAAGTLDRVNFSAFGTSGEFRGENKALAVYKTALTDTELANLTSYNNHDLFIPYRSRMQMIGADQELQCTEHDITRFL